MTGDRIDLFSWADHGRDGRDAPGARSRDARDAGLAAVSRADFTTRYLMFCRSLPSGSLVTGEDVSLGCVTAGIMPHHPNAWGAAANYAIKMGLLIDTGTRRQMQRTRSHARQTPVYRVR